MITTKELNHIREAGRQLVAVRNAVAEQSERLEQQTAYRKQVLVCGGTGCTSSGSKKVIAALEEALREEKLEKDVLVVKTGCFGLCALGPILIVYPEGAFYSQMTPEHTKRIVKEHLIPGGQVVKELLYQETVRPDGTIISLKETRFYKKQKRVALRNCGVIDPERIDEYIAFDGYKALAKVLTEMTPQQVIDTIKASGLRGRGGRAGRRP